MTKKVLISLFLFVCMLFTSMTGTVYAGSTEDFDPDNYDKLIPDEVMIVNKIDDTLTPEFIFIPEKSGEYFIESFDPVKENELGYVDTYCYVMKYDKDEKEFVFVTENDDIDEGNYMFKAAFKAEAGEIYKIGTDAYGEYINFKVRLSEVPYKAMAYTPVNPFVYNEYEDGEEDINTDEKQFFHYNFPSIQQGDTISLTTKDDEVIDFVYDDAESAFIAAGGEKIDKDKVFLNDTQYQGPWTPGKANYFTVTYDLFTAYVPVTIEHEHMLVKYMGQAPTCTMTGTETYWECEDCGGLFSDEECKNLISRPIKIDKLPHDLVKTEAAEPTATKTGNIEYWTCKVCNKHFADAEGKKELKDNGWVIHCENPVKVTGNTLKAKAAILKKKNVTFKSACTVKNAKGKVTYKVTKGKSKITVTSSGKVTLKKGLKKGTYKIKVKVTAAGNKTYKAKAKTVTVTVKVN